MNVLVVTHSDEHQDLILPDVLSALRRLGGPHRSHLVYDIPPRLKHRLWTLGLPTAVISMQATYTWTENRFRPEWAEIWEQAELTKVDELRLLKAAGVRVPRSTALYKDSPLDLTGFKEFVVVKPAHGSLGARVRIQRSDRVRYEPVEVHCHGLTGKPGISDAFVVEEYIHTGAWPTSYRVGTVFGEPIYALRIIASRARDPFPSEPQQPRDFVGRSIVASSRGCTIDGEVPKDVLEAARAAHAAFPNVPLLGVDIVRDCASGELYVLEVNATGGTFHLTSIAYESLRKEHGIDLKAQFGGAAAVARGIHRRLSWPSTKSRAASGSACR